MVIGHDKGQLHPVALPRDDFGSQFFQRGLQPFVQRQGVALGGVVTVGVFAHQKAQVCLLGTPAGVRTLVF